MLFRSRRISRVRPSSASHSESVTLQTRSGRRSPYAAPGNDAAVRRNQLNTLRAVVAMHDQFHIRLEHHHLLEATNAECGDPSGLEVTKPVVREGFLMARAFSFNASCGGALSCEGLCRPCAFASNPVPLTCQRGHGPADMAHPRVSQPRRSVNREEPSTHPLSPLVVHRIAGATTAHA